MTRGNIINLERAADHPSFNANIDRQTGYKTRSMLVMPIRSMQSSGGQMMLGGKPIGVVQCINKLGRGVAGKPPVFSHEDESTLGDFCQQLSPIVDKVRVKKRKAQFNARAIPDSRANFPTVHRCASRSGRRATRRPCPTRGSTTSRRWCRSRPCR